MSTRTALPIAASVLLVFPIAFAGADPPPSIAGMVIDGASQPVAAATVILTDATIGLPILRVMAATAYLGMEAGLKRQGREPTPWRGVIVRGVK